jgi:hypothetical protein
MNQKVIFLSKENQPSRISAKTFAAYKRAKREHLSANENYNRQVFGIDSLTYKWVQVAVQHVVGLCEDLEKPPTSTVGLRIPAIGQMTRGGT